MATTRKKAASGPTRKKGARAEGASRYTHSVYIRVDEPMHDWIGQLVARYGLRETDLLRRVLEDARLSQWNPAESMRRLAESAENV